MARQLNAPPTREWPDEEHVLPSPDGRQAVDGCDARVERLGDCGHARLRGGEAKHREHGRLRKRRTTVGGAQQVIYSPADQVGAHWNRLVLQRSDTRDLSKLAIGALVQQNP